jgi:hypothetical protein
LTPSNGVVECTADCGAFCTHSGSLTVCCSPLHSTRVSGGRPASVATASLRNPAPLADRPELPVQAFATVLLTLVANCARISPRGPRRCQRDLSDRWQRCCIRCPRLVPESSTRQARVTGVQVSAACHLRRCFCIARTARISDLICVFARCRASGSARSRETSRHNL